MTTQKLQMWQNSDCDKTQNVTKLKTKKFKSVTKLKNSRFDITQKPQNLTKLKKL